MIRTLKIAALATVLLGFSQAYSQELLGAKAVVKRMVSSTDKRNPGEMTAFEYADSLRKMSPKLAGEAWAQACVTKPKVSNPDKEGIGFYEDEFSALPPPESWTYIDAYFTAHKSPPIYQLMGSFLVGDKVRQRKLILQAAAERKDTIEIWRTMLSFGLAWRDQEFVAKAIHKLVDLQNQALLEPKPRTYSKLASELGKMMHFPDLVPAMGPEFARSQIQYALKNTKAMVLVQGLESQNIAIELCKKEGASYPIARYELIQKTGQADLLPMLDKWFPTSDSTAKQRAHAFYTQFKLLAGQSDIDWSDLELITNTRYDYQYGPVIQTEDDLDDQLKKVEVASRVVPILEKQLVVTASTEQVEMYEKAMTALGRRGQMKATLERVLMQKEKAKNNYTKFTAAGILRSILSLERTPSQMAALNLSQLNAGYARTEESLKLGMLLHRDDLIERAVAVQKEGDQNDYIESLFQLKRYSEMEANTLMRPFGEPSKLIFMYGEMGRARDIVDLLDNYPGWNGTDISHIRDYSDWDHKQNLQFEVARALLKLGKTAQGIRLLRTSLTGNGAVANAYELLIQTLGDSESLRELDDMARRDVFNPYPLVWKAKILLKGGKLSDAEIAIRQAFKIDPFECSEMRCKRTIPFVVLRDVLAAQGKESEATKVEQMVKALELADKAEDHSRAGLLAESADLLRQAEKLSPKSCFIQNSLALALVKLGQSEESKAHFRSAFERMPECMSRSTDHASDMWDGFTEGPGPEIAEEVFAERLKTEPNNPHLNFLMASLRKEQHRYAEAASYMNKTIELDPSYLNALDSALSSHIHPYLSPAQQAQYLVSATRLDPRSRHGYFRDEALLILNPEQLYRAVSYANQFHFEKEPMYRLAAAVKEYQTGGHGTAMMSYGPADTLPGKSVFDTELPMRLRKLILESRGQQDF